MKDGVKCVNKCFPKRKARRRQLSGQQRRSQSVKKWFRPKHQCFDFISGACEFSLSYGKVVIYNERWAKYRDSLNIQTASRIICSGAILDMGDWKNCGSIVVLFSLLACEFWGFKWNWNWKKGRRFNCYRVRGVWKGAEITIQTSFIILEFDLFFPYD